MTSSSRLPETYHITTLSPLRIGLAAELGVLGRRAAHVGERRLPADRLAGPCSGISAGLARSLSY